jgi:hypothetical protein
MYTDSFEVRKLRSRQYGIHVTPFHGAKVTVTVFQTPTMRDGERNLFHVFRIDSRQDWSKPNFTFEAANDTEVKGTEVRIVM